MRGARQVGKTYLVENWGKAHFEPVVMVDLERERELHEIAAGQWDRLLGEAFATHGLGGGNGAAVRYRRNR